MDDKFIIGVDIGGTWIRVAICTEDLNEKNLRIKKIKTLKENKFSIANSVSQTILEILTKNNINQTQILGIGIATAGPLDMEKGEIFNNANLGFRVIPLKDPIKKTFPKTPLFFINDANGAVLGIHFFEADNDEKENLVYITMSTGIGGGVICSGKLLLGKEGNAGEIGHVLVAPKSGIKCNCGGIGCWEAFSSGTGVLNRTLDAIKEGKLKKDLLMELVNNDISKITAKEAFQAAKKGDELSNKIVEDCIFYTKTGVGVVNNYYDPVSIYFGGAMMNDKEQIILPLKEQFENNPIQFTLNHPPRIKISRYKEEIGVRGALTLVKYKIEKNKVII
ncbi:MAG: ROK family protein [Promethearchaeota archaeon]